MHPELLHFHYLGQDRTVFTYGVLMLAGLARPHAPAARLCALAGPIHPVQLYEAAGLLAIMAIVLVAERRRRAPGTLFLLYLALYALLRLAMEGLRGDFVERGYLVPGLLTTS